MMTHPSILKINELFNNKLSKHTNNIKLALNYKANFIDQELFDRIRELLISIGYTDIQGQLDTLFCIVDSIKHNQIKIESIANNKIKAVFNAFRELLKLGIVSFDSRIRRDILVCIYLDSSNVNFKTNFLKLDQHKILYEKVIHPLLKSILIIREIELKIDSADMYNQIYENSKSVMENMNSRGMSFFAIACYFWINNRELIPKPFLYNWSNHDLIKGISAYPDFNVLVNEEIKQALANVSVFWSVLSEQSLLTGRVQNINKNRKLLNEAINLILDDLGRNYIKDYLKKIKLISTGNPILTSINNPKEFLNNFYKEIEKQVRFELTNRTMKVPSKELIIEAIKYQFMISRVTDIDFSNKRKDHLILDKNTRKRIFE